MAPTSISDFNAVYFEFLKFIKEHIEDSNFKTFYRKNKIIRETNPKLFIRTWYDRIGSKYHEQIMKSEETPLMKKFGVQFYFYYYDKNGLLIKIIKADYK